MLGYKRGKKLALFYLKGKKTPNFIQFTLHFETVLCGHPNEAALGSWPPTVCVTNAEIEAKHFRQYTEII